MGRGYGTPATVGQTIPYGYAASGNYRNTLGYGNIGYGSIGYGNVGYAAPAVAAVAPVAAVRSYAAHAVAPIAAVRSYAGPIAASAGYRTLGYGARLGYNNLW